MTTSNVTLSWISKCDFSNWVHFNKRPCEAPW